MKTFIPLSLNTFFIGRGLLSWAALWFLFSLFFDKIFINWNSNLWFNFTKKGICILNISPWMQHSSCKLMLGSTKLSSSFFFKYFTYNYILRYSYKLPLFFDFLWFYRHHIYIEFCLLCELSLWLLTSKGAKFFWL